MGRSTNVPFSILISARLPLLTLRASATAFGMRTARLFPHLQNSTIMTRLRKVETMYIQCSCLLYRGLFSHFGDPSSAKLVGRQNSIGLAANGGGVGVRFR